MIFKLGKSEYAYDKENDEITAELNGSIKVRGVTKKLFGIGKAWREKNDTNDKQFGDALATIRAIKDLANDAENYLIKQSCVDSKSKSIGNITATLNLNTDKFRDEIRYVGETIDELRYRTRFLGEWKSEFVPKQKLKQDNPMDLRKFEGRWVTRTKPCKCHYGNDGSFISDPIKFVKVTDDYIKFKSKGGNTVSALTGNWVTDGNWELYEGDE